MATVFESRIKSEYKKAIKHNKEKKSFIIHPDPDDLHMWYVLLYDLDDPYKGGEYLVQFKLPKEYPFKSPVVKFLTPNGRYILNDAICIYGVTHFHEEANNSATDLCSMVLGVISTMYYFEHGVGSINTTDKEKKEFAALSVEYNIEHNKKIIDKLNEFR